MNTSSFDMHSKAISMTVDWNRAREKDPKYFVQVKAGSKRWCKQPDGWLKINLDAACN